MKYSRRDLLRYGACGLLGRVAFMTGFDRFSIISGMAATTAPADYKALVCIFLFGGNDANNTIVSIDNYANYAAKRGSDLAIAQASLLPITPASGGNYGLHPSMTALQSMFSNPGKMSSKPPLAVIANVGTLIAPINKTQYQSGVRPYQLFSHSDQQSEWQTSISNSDAPSGWAGRMADLMHDSATGFPNICSMAGVPIFTVGASTQPVAIPPAPTALNQTLTLVKPDNLIQTILTADQNPALPALVKASSNVTQFALNNSALLSSNPTITTAFPANNALGNQLLQVARVIKLNSSLGLKRQI